MTLVKIVLTDQAGDDWDIDETLPNFPTCIRRKDKQTTTLRSLVEMRGIYDHADEHFFVKLRIEYQAPTATFSDDVFAFETSS